MCRLKTDRLTLRATTPSDAERAFEIQSDWNVTRMLRMASFPPDQAEISRWFGDHSREWIAGEAYRFSIMQEDRMIGVIDLDNIAQSRGELGYWIEQAAWGRGYAYEAAQAIVRFAFEDAELSQLRSGHAADNPASARVLFKLGFCYVESICLPSCSRNESTRQLQYRLLRSLGA